MTIRDPLCLLVPSRSESLQDGARDAEFFEKTKTDHIVDRVEGLFII